MTDIIYRCLGRNGPKVPALGFGAMGLSAFYGNVTDEESLEVLKMAIDEGCTFIDTASFYGPPQGKNERLIGQLLKDPSIRSKVFIGSKIGAYWTEDGSLKITGKPELIRKYCEESLRNLQVDYIDLAYLNRVDRDMPIEETWGEFKRLQDEGKVKYLGLSEATADEIRRAHAVAPVSAIEIEWHPRRMPRTWNLYSRL